MLEMRICIISQFAYGTNISPRLYQASLLSRRGHEVFFVTPRQQPMLRFMKSVTPAPEAFDGVKIHYFNVTYPIPSLAYPVPRMTEEINLINNIIQHEKADVLHFYQPEFLTSVPLPLIKAKFNKPTLLTVNGFPGINWYYGSRMVDLAGLVYTHTIARCLVRYADKILLYARNLRFFAKAIGVPDDKMVYLPEGITLDLPKNTKEIRDLTRYKLRVSDDETLIAFTGRLVPVKRVDTLVKSFKRLHSEHPNCKLLIVGDGPSRKLLEAQSGDLLNKAVIFAGLVRPESVVRFLLASDIFVLPSLSEGIPSSILEACYCGLPCISTNTGAIPDIIKDGETGILLKQSDEKNLWHALVRLATDEKMAKKMGENARARVKRIFNWNEIIERYEQICIDLIEKQKMS